MAAPNVARWRANGVEGATQDSRTTLRHLEEDAELHVVGGRLVRGDGYATASRGARQSLARMGAVLRLRQHNRFYIHASAVVNQKGLAYLFVGESGSGKSTLAFALARIGWRILGDDGVVLEPRSDGVLAHAWRSPSLVSAGLAAFFPELAGCDGQIVPGDLRRRVPMSVPVSCHARVGAIVFIKQGSYGSLESCGESQALTLMIGQSPWVLLGDAETPSHFRALKSIIASTPLFEFVHGPAELIRIGEFFDSAA